MNPNEPKIELNSLNVNKLGIEQSTLYETLKDAIRSYRSWYIDRSYAKALGEPFKVKQPYSLKSIQKTQARMNKIRYKLGLSTINLLIDLRIWKRKFDKGDEY